jgi:ElaB/YqjD/DUF883 family membrane-anchored ribosome-binding protein
VRETAHDIRDRVAGTGEQMMRGAQDLAGTVQDYSAAMGEQVADTAERTSRQTTQAVREAKDSLMSFVNEQPLVAAAIGVAIGAAIAAMLPSTETEDELMGEASDAVKDAVSGVASDQLGAAKAAATRLAQEAMSAAEREGLTAQAAVDAARKLGEKVTSVVSDAGAAGQSEFQELAGAGAGLGSGSNAGQDQNNKPDFKAR